MIQRYPLNKGKTECKETVVLYAQMQLQREKFERMGCRSHNRAEVTKLFEYLVYIISQIL